MLGNGRKYMVRAGIALAALVVGVLPSSVAWADGPGQERGRGHDQGRGVGHDRGHGQNNGRFDAGDPGVGDPYFPLYGNGGYNARHYQLDITYDPESDNLDGRASIWATATEDLFQFNLDLTGLTVRSITVNNRPAQWSREGRELIITPQQKLKDGGFFKVVVTYDGVPPTFTIPSLGIEAGFIHTDDGTVVAGEPEVATAWYPVNDHPLDKATYSFNITVPEGLAAVSNGRLLTTRTSDGWTTWRWVATEPMASYLTTATIGEFDIRRYSTESGLPVFDAVDPDLGDIADNAIGQQGEVLTFLESQFGPYPFHALGAVVDDYEGLFFALENQTRAVYSQFFFEPGDNPGEVFVVVHELAHQWYGDSVSVHFWKHLWLNEGFATYAEWLWSEHTFNQSAQMIFDFLYVQPESEPFWSPPPGDPGVEQLFSSSVYTRGGMTLHALRMTVGDDAFFEILRTWAEERRNSNGTTEQFVALAERVSGQQLDDLFNAWLFTEGKPPYPGGSAAGPSASTLAAQEPPIAVQSLRDRLRTGRRF